MPLSLDLGTVRKVIGENLSYKDIYLYLRQGSRGLKRANYKNSRGAIKNRMSIEKRPNVIKSRERLGDVEVDLMPAKDHGSALLVMTERSTLITPMNFCRVRTLK